MFRQMDLKGKNSKDDTQLKTVHQNTIATIRNYDESGGSVRQFSSMYIIHDRGRVRPNMEQRAASMVEWLFGQLDKKEY